MQRRTFRILVGVVVTTVVAAFSLLAAAADERATTRVASGGPERAGVGAPALDGSDLGPAPTSTVVMAAPAVDAPTTTVVRTVSTTVAAAANPKAASAPVTSPTPSAPASPAAPAGPDPSVFDPRMTVSPPSGPVGTTLVVSGQWCTGGQTLNIWVMSRTEPRVMLAPQASHTTTMSLTWEVRIAASNADAPPGIYDVTASCYMKGMPAFDFPPTTFTLTA
jgi:hypothetical protein